MRGNISTEIIEITPQEAQRLLLTYDGTGEKRQRRVNKARVYTFAEDMRKGRWRLNGETIIISEDGKLLNGQHRMLAVIQNESPQEFLVVKGVREDAFDTIDGGAGRSIKDVLYINKVPYYQFLAPITRRHFEYCLLGKFLTGGSHNIPGYRKPSSSELMDFIEEHPELHVAAKYVGNHVKGARFIPPAPWGSLYCTFDKVDPSLRNSFFGKLVSGTGLENGDPVLALREKLIKIRENDLRNRSNTHASAKALYIIKAWNLCRKGESIKKLPSLKPKEYPSIQ